MLSESPEELLGTTERTVEEDGTSNEIIKYWMDMIKIPTVTTMRPPGASETFSTEPENFTLPERNALAQLRPLVAHLLIHEYAKTDAMLIQWLRENLDVRKTADLIYEVQEWRAENNVDGILNETIAKFKPPPYVVEGYDREGTPLILFTPSHLDIRKILVRGWQDKAHRYIIQIFEKVVQKQLEASRIFGKEITQVALLVDAQGFNLRQHACMACIPTGLDLYVVLNKYYPGMLKYAILINVPRVALPFMEILRPLLSREHLDAIRYFPPNRKEWSEYINNFISSDQLPMRFGGTKTDLRRK